MKKIMIIGGLLLMFFLINCWSSCSLTEIEGLLILENNYLKITLNPSSGGKASSIIYKKGNIQLTAWPDYGCFEDRLWQDKNYMFPSLAYNYRIEKNTPEQVSIVLFCYGRGSKYASLLLEKKITIFNDKSYIQLDYTATNNGKFAIPIGLWFANNLKTPESRLSYYQPSQYGVNRISVTIGKGLDDITIGLSNIYGNTREIVIYDLPVGWSGVVDEKGNGGIFIFDPRITSFTYNYIGNADNPIIEWCLNEVEVKPGESLKTSYSLLPLSGIKELTGADNNIACYIKIPEKVSAGDRIDAEITLLSGQNLEAEIIFEDMLVKGSYQTLDKKNIILTTDQPAKLSTSFESGVLGTHSFRVRVKSGDNIIAEFEKPFIVGDIAGEYILQPKTTERIGRVNERYKAVSIKKPGPADTALYIPVPEVVTPHIKWANPYAGGKIKVLIVEPYTHTREVIELYQRLSIDYEVIPLSSRFSVNETEADLLSKKLNENRFDCIIVGSNITLPEQIKSLIADKVASGSGLILVNPKWNINNFFESDNTKKEVENKIRSSIPSDVKCGIAFYKNRDGKVVSLTYTMDKRGSILPNCEYLPNVYKNSSVDLKRLKEYYYLLLIKTILYVSNKQMPVEIWADIDSLNLVSGKESNLNVIVKNSADKQLSAKVQLIVSNRFEENKCNISTRVILQPGETKNVLLQIPALGEGYHIFDFSLLDEIDQVLTLQSLFVEIKSFVKITDIKLDKDFYSPGDNINFSVEFSKNPDVKVKPFLTVEVKDTQERIVYRTKKMAVNTNPFIYKISTENWLTKLNYLFFRLYNSNTIVDEEIKTVVISKNNDEPFRFMNTGKGLLGQIERKISEFEIDTLNYGFLEDDEFAKNNVDRFTWGTPLPFFQTSTATEKSLIRSGCFTDPVYRKNIVKKWIEKELKQANKYKYIGLIFYDEWDYSGGGGANNLCHSPTCLEGFREFLKAEYVSIDNLNKEWETSYSDWHEIHPPLWKDVVEKKLYCQWVDHRRWIETNVANFIKYLHDEGKKIYPDVKFALSGTREASSWNGYDWWKLSQTMKAVALYGGRQREIVRSLFPGESFVTTWTGYSDTEYYLRYWPWNILFNDEDGIMYYGLSSDYAEVLYPDLRLKKAGLWLKTELDVIKSGISHLLKNSVKIDDPIAIHYSQSSLHLATLDQLKGISGGIKVYNNNLSNMINLIQDTGLQFRFVAYEQIEKGELINQKYRVLILPYSQALSLQEAEQIKKFVQEGGIVIADVKPGIYDNHGKELQKGLLDDLFGIKRISKNATYAYTSIVGTGSFQNIHLTGKNISVIQGETGIQSVSAVSLAQFEDSDKTPAVFINKYGKGYAILLNFLLTPFSEFREALVTSEEDPSVVSFAGQKANSIRELISQLLSLAEISPALKIHDNSDKPYPPFGYEIIYYQDKDAKYFGVLPPQKKNKVKLVFPKSGYLYELREGKSFGFTRSIDANTDELDIKLYALLPGELKSIHLNVKPGYKKGETINYKVIVDRPYNADVVCRLEVFDPSGNLKKLYSKKIIVKGGTFSGKIPIALNDVSGVWKIKITDIISKKYVEKSFKIVD